MKKLLLALFAMAGITAAHAQVSGNLGLTSDYRFRGISQSQNAPAVQGGVTIITQVVFTLVTGTVQ